MVSRGFMDLVAEANAAIETISAEDALALVSDANVVFVDVRESVERQSGAIKGSVHAPRGFLELCADETTPMHVPELASGKRCVLFCASGGRSALAAKTLLDMGLTNVCHMDGGMGAWTQAGGPVE